MESQTDGPPPDLGDEIRRRYRLPTPEQMAENDVPECVGYWTWHDTEGHGYLPPQASHPRSFSRRGSRHLQGSPDETGSWGGDPGFVLGHTRRRVAGEWGR
jgi:hypothetical protein